MICNNSSAAGGSIKDLTINPPEFSHSQDWSGSTTFVHSFSGLTKGNLGKGVIVAVVASYDRGYVKVCISPDGTAETITSGAGVKIESPYNLAAGTLSISMGIDYSSEGNYFILRTD